MFEDTPEFIARYIVREARAYLDSLAAAVLPRADPLRGRRLLLLALPGALRRRGLPEEPGGPDVPPVLRREHAARRRLQRGGGTGPVARPHRPGGGLGAQCGAHLQRRPPVLRHQRHLDLEQDRLALDRGAGRHRGGGPQLPQVDPARHHHDRRDPGLPDADAQPLRHHRADPAGASSSWENIQKKIAANPFAREAKTASRASSPSPRAPTTASCYNVETIKEMLDGEIDTLHFDEAWLPHAAFHDFYGDYHAIGADRPRCKESMIFSTQSTHKLLAGLSQASQILVQDSENAQARPRRVQRGLPDAHVHQPAVRHHRLLRRGGGDDGTARRHGAGGGIDPGGARLPPRHAQGGRGVRRVAGGSRSGGRTTWPRKASASARTGCCAPGERWHGFGNLAPGFNMLDPIKATVITPGAGRGRRLRRLGHSGGHRHQVPGRARHHRREDRPLFLLHHVHHRHHQGPLEHAW